MFSETEVAYIRSQGLARLATAAPRTLQPDVAAVAYQFDGTCFYIGGLEQEATLKFKNAKANPKAALVIDDLASVKPWLPRGIKIHGDIDIVERRVEIGSPFHLRLKPRVKWVWGIDEPALQGGRAFIKKTLLV